ncbi:hypothetical protein IWW36_002935 [Coemansia brasiliensis]|uniref:Glutathione S-transferase n=1 Tax=Coemansia brasiliensis TaxID=2650707 RepID=A0A9W8LZ08_9FUNG|nr:hypothetical protein IWW36_002935 [Coemansia brasiliensis]
MPTDTSFVLRYFDLIGRAEGARLLLTAGKANWTEEHPEWPAEKDKQPFKRLPVLVEKNGDDEWIICESPAIERYLARKFGFFPTDIKQAAEQEQMAEQQYDVVKAFFDKIMIPQEKLAKIGDGFDVLLDRMIEQHTKILEKNSHGYLFGDSLSYADISCYAFYKLFILYMPVYQQDIASVFTSKITPQISAFISFIESNPLLVSYVSKSESVAAAFWK